MIVLGFVSRAEFLVDELCQSVVTCSKISFDACQSCVMCSNDGLAYVENSSSDVFMHNVCMRGI